MLLGNFVYRVHVSTFIIFLISKQISVISVISVCPKIPSFLSFRQSLSRNLLEGSNGFPLKACGNDKFGQTLISGYISLLNFYPQGFGIFVLNPSPTANCLLIIPLTSSPQSYSSHPSYHPRLWQILCRCRPH